MYSLSLHQIRKGLLNKDFSSLELTELFLGRIEQYNKRLNAFITVCSDHALKSAKRSDARIAKGEARALEGIPLAMKDLFLTKGVRTTAGSRMLDNFIPPYESTVSDKLIDAGAVLLGKTNMDEFAMGSSNLTSYYGGVVNPWSREKKLVPGGSSGGSASAVAGHLCAAATGSDTGGSVRQPASFSGIVGLKPTYGRCSRYGMVAFASSLDQAGTLTKTVRDAAIFLQTIAGYDEKDSTSSKENVPDLEAFVGRSIKGLRIGIPREYRVDGMSEEILLFWEKGAELLKNAGAEVMDVSLPYAKYALPAYYIIAPAEASSNLARYDGVKYGFRIDGVSLNEVYKNTRGEGFGDEVKRRILIGTYVLSAGYYDAYYMKALKVQKLIRQDFATAFQNVDVLLIPTTPNCAFAFGEEPMDPVTMYLNDIFTVPANIAGLPAISVPVGVDKQQRPLGLQLIAPAFREDLLVQVGNALEEAVDFHPLKEMMS
ncbi:MAG: Asp-tRNA(Asn)/Glu-tRNA(Gln) amidotransferase subunit GatA [Holosporaceae bacterium]|jgi:aspartyl-tRNA(Asn)/glutamyl-tRNA(Gln) amidotransferase subunit A|nr:Asp-tRNA(Asn)/Glu-tRNA(Gln) amidotransferase subunit GatA [Holosporaceae bacterium]